MNKPRSKLLRQQVYLLPIKTTKPLNTDLIHIHVEPTFTKSSNIKYLFKNKFWTVDIATMPKSFHENKPNNQTRYGTT